MGDPDTSSGGRRAARQDVDLQGSDRPQVGESYLGGDIRAMDLMPPIEATHWSQAKATTTKPTIVYSARQHASDVSSTSHVLKLAELLLTDPEFKEKLRKVNVVIHPVTNPDGAQLAYDLQEITPHHMLHASYLGALGVDVTAGQGEPDPIYPEAKVPRDLADVAARRLPEPPRLSHPRVGAALLGVRGLGAQPGGGDADYWSMRGWWMPGVRLARVQDSATLATQLQPRQSDRTHFDGCNPLSD